MIVFSDSLSGKTLKMTERIIEERARAVEILVVFTLNMLFILSSTLFLILSNPI